MGARPGTGAVPESYDLVCIGSGPAGQRAAVIALSARPERPRAQALLERVGSVVGREMQVVADQLRRNRVDVRLLRGARRATGARS